MVPEALRSIAFPRYRSKATEAPATGALDAPTTRNVTSRCLSCWAHPDVSYEMDWTFMAVAEVTFTLTVAAAEAPSASVTLAVMMWIPP